MDYNEFFSNPIVIWFLLGFVMMLLELVMPGVIIIFFGIGAWITALCCMIFSPPLAWQIAIFTVTSVLSLIFLRRWLLDILFKKKEKEETLSDEFLGQKAITETVINGARGGKVTFKGALWDALSSEKIKAGEQVEIIGKESIKLVVKPVDNS